MKFIIVFAALFAVALAAPATKDNSAVTVLRSVSDVGPDGFSYSYETSDGSSATATGEVKNKGAENEAINVRGAYSYVADDGVTYTVTYTADENGFHPEGAHLPVAV